MYFYNKLWTQSSNLQIGANQQEELQNLAVPRGHTEVYPGTELNQRDLL